MVARLDEAQCQALLAAHPAWSLDRDGAAITRQFTFADEPFTIDNEELTPKQSIRRHKLKARYGERLDALYKG